MGFSACCRQCAPSPHAHSPFLRLFVTVSAFSTVLPLMVSACQPEDYSGAQSMRVCGLPHTRFDLALIWCMLGLLQEMPAGCHIRQPHLIPVSLCHH